MSPDLNTREVHLWCAVPDEIGDEALLREYGGLLTDAERQQQQRFRFARDRRRYLVTRALVRTVLSRYAPVAPGDWRFAAGPYGKPAIDNDPQWAAELSFNVSHTQGLIVLGVTRRRPIGVDTENMYARQPLDGLAEKFFAPAEVLALRRMAQDEQARRFYEYWTLKESYIKARAMGLSIPLDGFSFEFGEGMGLLLSIRPDQEDRPTNWRFWLIQQDAGFPVAVCVGRDGPEVSALRAWATIPLVSERVSDYALLRCSHGV